LNRIVIAGIAAGCLTLVFWLITRPGQVVSRDAPNCSDDGGRRVITQIIAVCLSPDTYAAARHSGDGTDFFIPGLAEPLSALSAASVPRVEKDDDLVWPSLLGVSGKPLVKRSDCHGFAVFDGRWKRVDGMQSRQIVAMGTSIGYRWVSQAAAHNFDRILDTWTCRDDLKQ
jgi:hypothetical protein